MTKFIQNLNKYIDHHNIKKSFISKITGIEKNKFSRLLNGKQDILCEDMILITKSLGEKDDYFMQDSLILEKLTYQESTSIGFHMGDIDGEKEKLANEIFDLLEHVDAILGIQNKIDKDSSEVFKYEF